MTNSDGDQLCQRLAAVQDRLERACRRAGREPADVTLVAVTKKVDVVVARRLAELGVVDLGENRPQELWRKSAELPQALRWHLIGHLQRNKVERTIPLVHIIHSVDSIRLLEAIEEEAARQARQVSVLLEVNASREAAKHGFSPETLMETAASIRRLRQTRVLGLMTMAAYSDDPETSRLPFVETRTLRDRLQTELGPDYPLPHLSMGMTNDFEIAVEEGATMVRIGSALFEDLPGTNG